MRHEKSAGAIIFYLEKTSQSAEPVFLLLKYPTYWGFVKGLIENGESIEETIRREAKEEANLNNLKFWPGFRYMQEWFFKWQHELVKKQALFLLAEVSKEETKHAKVSEEHEALEWLSYNDAMQRLKIKNNREMLAKAYKFIKKKLKEGRQTRLDEI